MAPSMSPVALRSQVFLCLRGHCYRIMECKPEGGGGGKSFVYSLFIECLPDSVVNAAFLSVPFQGVCSVARCCGQSEPRCEVAAYAVTFEAATHSVYAFVIGRANGKVNV